jgi:hypothetical protein
MTGAMDTTLEAACAARTLGQLHLWSERKGRRKGGVFQWMSDGRQEMPAWRFYRHVIRVALFLRERLHVAPGDTVLVEAPLGVERAIAEWAIVSLGAVAGFPDAEPSTSRVPGRLALVPKAAFVADCFARALAETWPQLPAEATIIIGTGDRPPTTLDWTEVVELGGTLDTAERARSVRECAASLTPQMPAIAQVHTSNGWSIRTMSHGDIVDRLVQFWAAVPPTEGDVAYVSTASVWTSVCFPTWAFLADGTTTTVFGSPDRAPDEIAQVGPRLVVGASSDVDAAEPRPARPPVRRSRTERLPIVRHLVDRFGRRPAAPSLAAKVREIVTFEGIRVPQPTRSFP